MDNKVLGLRTVIYKVADMNAAKAWYAKVFETQPYFDEPFYLGFDIGGYELGLQPEHEKTEEKSENVLTYWGVDDVQSAFGKFIAEGAVVHESPNEVGGGIIVATVKDPWSNIIGLIYNPHFKI